MQKNTNDTLNNLFYDAFRASSIGIVVENLEGQPLFVNPAFCSMLGFSEEEMRHKHCVDFSPPEDAEKDWALFQQLRARTIDHYQLDKRYIRRDGSLVWGRLNVSLLNGRPTPLVLAMVEDFTERKLAEEAIETSEVRYRRIVETTNEGVWLLDSKLRNSYVNQQMAGMLGYAPSEMLGLSVLDFYFPEDLEHKKQSLTRRQQGTREQRDERLRRKDGSELWVQISATPVFTDAGEFDGALAMMSDITERRRAQEALRQSEEKFRTVFRDAGVGMIIVSLGGRYLAANRTFCDYLGYTEQELLKKSVESITFPQDWPSFAEKLREVLAGTAGFHWLQKRCLHKSGRIVHTESSTTLIRNRMGDPQYFVAQVSDITARKKAEEALSGMTRKLIEAQEQERARISRELHDDICQRMAMLAIELERLQSQYPEARDRVKQLQRHTDDIVTDVQALSHDLHSSKLEYLGVIGGIRSWCREFGERQNVKIDFRSQVSTSLSLEIGYCLLRVIQESLHNAVKHSAVKCAEVYLTELDGEVHLLIEDRGIGFDVELAMAGRGLGLTSMRERVRLVNGTISITSQPSKGTIIDVRVPLEILPFQQPAVG